MIIYHIITFPTIEYKNQLFYPPELKKDGFIHCSFKNQVKNIVDTKFKNKKNLYIIKIDSNFLKEVIKVEDLYNLNEEYPHIYGPINKIAIMGIYKYEKGKL